MVNAPAIDDMGSIDQTDARLDAEHLFGEIFRSSEMYSTDIKMNTKVVEFPDGTYHIDCHRFIDTLFAGQVVLTPTGDISEVELYSKWEDETFKFDQFETFDEFVYHIGLWLDASTRRLRIVP